MNSELLKNIIESALLASGRPLSLSELRDLFPRRECPERSAISEAIATLQSEFEARGIELVEVATGFRIQIRSSMIDWLTKLWEERPPRYSRALLETLALIAYQQPITRGDIEDVRGVAVSTNIMRTLQERGWVRIVGHRDVPGKPALYATTTGFLDYFGLRKLEDLPPLAEISDFEAVVPQLELEMAEESALPLHVVVDQGDAVPDSESLEAAGDQGIGNLETEAELDESDDDSDDEDDDDLGTWAESAESEDDSDEDDDDDLETWAESTESDDDSDEDDGLETWAESAESEDDSDEDDDDDLETEAELDESDGEPEVAHEKTSTVD